MNMNNCLVSLYVLLIFVMSANAASVEFAVDSGQGTYDVRDIQRGELVLQGARIGFSIAPYVELKDVVRDDVETNREVVEYVSSDGDCRKGADGCLIFRKESVGELEVHFIPHLEPTYLEMAFSFRNLGDVPVRLRSVTVADGGFLPEQSRDSMLLLAGHSGGAKTFVSRATRMKSENNILSFFPDHEGDRSLVAGGLTYDDFRKFVEIKGTRICLFADDPVGKRVDPGSRYDSPDRFYLDGMTDNPFEALESYAKVTEKARGIQLNYYTFPSVCMWFLGMDTFSGDTKNSTNSSVGAVEEMRCIAESGFLKYSKAAVRLVPDCYEQNNQQGWWDDKHWQMHGRKYRCPVNRHYEEPYETTEKWTGKVRELGGIPLTYFQPGIRSEDYADAFPDHMLYNQVQKLILKDGQIVYDPHPLMGNGFIRNYSDPSKPIPGYGKLWAESYDYTDPEFLAHWREVNRNLFKAGVQGVFYDYPTRAFPERGGLEDRYATALQAYRMLFRVAREELGPDAYLQERLGIGSDATLEFVSSVRTTGDTNKMRPDLAGINAMRWYKNRRLTNYDADGKAILELIRGDDARKLSQTERRAVLTVSYAVTGRLLLTESFRRFDDDVIFDLSRVFPFHATPLSARPVDAFCTEKAIKVGEGEMLIIAHVGILLHRKEKPSGISAESQIIGEWGIVDGPIQGSVIFKADGTWGSPWPEWHGSWALENNALKMVPKGTNSHLIQVVRRPFSGKIKVNPSLPKVYDFAISEDWHQVVLWGKKKFSIPFSGVVTAGALGLDPTGDYYVYDFWNDAFVGRYDGTSMLEQELKDAEARMLSIHKVQKKPQWISTDRHIMQGYVDLIQKPVWDSENRTLSGISSVIGGEPYRVTIALNGYEAESCQVKGGAKGKLHKRDKLGLVDLVIEADRNTDVKWSVVFAAEL